VQPAFHALKCENSSSSTEGTIDSTIQQHFHADGKQLHE
jgi:hypothetical protein